MTKEQLSEFVNLINDTEDQMAGGWRSSHEPVEIHTAAVRETPVPSVSRSGSTGGDSLEQIASEIRACRACGLCAGRKIPVPGAGVINPVVMFIGEGPGAEEDKTGIPFVGRAGQYLDKWLSAIDLKREQNCFIGNIIKCRPPGNRDPLPDEIAACRPFLIRQLEIIRPLIIVTLGRFASQVICGSDEGIGRLRGRVHEYHGLPVVPTYHPSAVLRNQQLRAAVWEDLKKVRVIADDVGRR